MYGGLGMRCIYSGLGKRYMASPITLYHSDFKVKMRLLHTSSGVCLMKHKSSLSYKRGVVKPNIEFQFCTDIQNLSLEVREGKLRGGRGGEGWERRGLVKVSAKPLSACVDERNVHTTCSL